MKVCDRCGIALTSAHGGSAERVMVCWPNHSVTTADLCRGCYQDAVRPILEALLGPRKAAAA